VIQQNAIDADKGRNQKQADEESAAADQQTRNKVIERAQHQAGASQGLSQTDKLIATSAQCVGIIQIAVVETKLDS
jgi:hypothetical protein